MWGGTWKQKADVGAGRAEAWGDAALSGWTWGTGPAQAALCHRLLWGRELCQIHPSPSCPCLAAVVPPSPPPPLMLLFCHFIWNHLAGAGWRCAALLVLGQGSSTALQLQPSARTCQRCRGELSWGRHHPSGPCPHVLPEEVRGNLSSILQKVRRVQEDTRSCSRLPACLGGLRQLLPAGWGLCSTPMAMAGQWWGAVARTNICTS